MNAQDRDQIEEVKSSVRSLGQQIRQDIRDLWKAREADKADAKQDNDRRHQELREDFARVIARLDLINGNVRDNTGRIDRMEGARDAERGVLSNPRKAAAAGAGGLAGAAAIIWAMIEFAKVLIQ